MQIMNTVFHCNHVCLWQAPTIFWSESNMHHLCTFLNAWKLAIALVFFVSDKMETPIQQQYNQRARPWGMFSLSFKSWFMSLRGEWELWYGHNSLRHAKINLTLCDTSTAKAVTKAFLQDETRIPTQGSQTRFEWTSKACYIVDHERQCQASVSTSKDSCQVVSCPRPN